MALRSIAPVRVPQGLDTRLLAELQRNNLSLEPSPLALLSSAQRFVDLYRQAIEQLEAKVA